MQQAAFLVIDLGNTAAKLRLARAGSLLGETRRVPTAALLSPAGPEAFREALAGWDYGRAILSSVVPDAARVIVGVVPPEKLLRVTPELDTGVDLRGYPGKAKLGQDRVANMAGALARHGPGPLIVVDFGTAATFNALDVQGRFLGGVIAPGWTAVSGYLPSRAAQLPPVRYEGAAPRAIGRSTSEAMRAGALIGFRGLAREIIQALRTELGASARVIATGGDARFLAKQGLLAADMVDPHLTLHGLRVIAARNVSPPSSG